MSREIVRAQALLQTMNTPGWKVLEELVEQAMREAEQEVINCPNESDIISLQRKAQASRKFWTNLLSKIRQTTNVDDAGLAGSL